MKHRNIRSKFNRKNRRCSQKSFFLHTVCTPLVRIIALSLEAFLASETFRMSAPHEFLTVRNLAEVKTSWPSHDCFDKRVASIRFFTVLNSCPESVFDSLFLHIRLHLEIYGALPRQERTIDNPSNMLVNWTLFASFLGITIVYLSLITTLSPNGFVLKSGTSKSSAWLRCSDLI